MGNIKIIYFAFLISLPTVFHPLGLAKEDIERAANERNTEKWAREENRIACRLLERRLNDRSTVNQNIIFSPRSLITTLAMVAYGARGPTADQIAKEILTPLHPAQTEAALGILDPSRGNPRYDLGLRTPKRRLRR